jgi:hypothetical protein
MAVRYGRTYGLRAGLVSLVPLLVGAVAIIVLWQQVVDLRTHYAPAYVDCTHRVGLSGLSGLASCQRLLEPRRPLVLFISTLNYGLLFAGFLATIAFCAIAGHKVKAMSGRRRSAALSALVVVLLAWTMFTLVGTVSAALMINPQLLLDPLASYGSVQPVTPYEDLVEILGMDFSYLLPTLVVGVLAGLLGGLR